MLRFMGSQRVGHNWATELNWRQTEWQPTPVFLPGESQGWRSLVGCCPWGCTESDMTEPTQQQQQQQDKQNIELAKSEIQVQNSLATSNKNKGCSFLLFFIAYYLNTIIISFLYQFSSVQSLRCVRLFATPWTIAHQASLSISNSQSLLKLMSIESVIPSYHLILYRLPSLPAFNLSKHKVLF